MDISEVRGSGRLGERVQLELLGTLNHDLPVGLVVIDLDLRIVRANKVAQALLGLKEADLLGHTVAEISPEADKQLGPILQRVLQGEIVYDWAFPEDADYLDEYDRVISSPEGDVRLWASSFFPIEFDQRMIGIGVVAINRSVEHFSRNALAEMREEVSLLVATDAACAKSKSVHELYGAICDIAVGVDDLTFAWVGQFRGDGMAVVVQSGVDNGFLRESITTANESDAFIHGPTGQSLLTGHPYVVNNYASAPATKPWHEAAKRAGFAASIAIPFTISDAPVATLTIYSSKVDRFTSHLVSKLKDIVAMATIAIERLQLRESERQMTDILKMRDFALASISHCMIYCDPRQLDSPITYVSSSFSKITGYTEHEVIGKNCSILLGPGSDPESARQIHEALVEGRTLEVEILSYRKNGESFWSHISLFPFYNEDGVFTRCVGTLSDVTEQHRLEGRMMQSQKLEAIGTLAGGIAHDINNLLLVIQGYTSLILNGTEDPELHDTAERIQNAVERGAQFTNRLLAYSRQQIHRPQVINLNDAVLESIELLESASSQNITIATSFQEVIGPVLMDPSQVQQIVLNLVNNSIEAMPDGGTITLRSSEVELNEMNVLRFDDCLPGPYVVFEVSDEGVGMDEETRHRAFEPFFTTKKTGTGLGLASVYGIVHQSKGHIEVESKPDLGTIFRLYFPQTEPLPPSPVLKAPLISDLDESDFDVFGDETILIVEDDAEALALLSNALRKHGFIVLHASNGRDAVELSRRYNGPIDVLLSDVVMPQMNGRETAELIVAQRPNLRVVYTSGFPSNLLRRKELIDENFEFVEKPYRTKLVAQVIRGLLDRDDTPR